MLGSTIQGYLKNIRQMEKIFSDEPGSRKTNG